ncbi:MAG: hypothetical protein MRY32_05380 [Rickettsiales bacterium]|nr:hypothetical protein [Rickettsiales bacterium]
MRITSLAIGLTALLVLSGCNDLRHRYNKIYEYKPSSYVGAPAYITGGHFQNVSGVTNEFNDTIGYGHIRMIDDMYAPREDVPSDMERLAYSVGGYAVGQQMRFKTYPIDPGPHRIMAEITVFGRTKTKVFNFMAQSGMQYFITGQSGGLTASVWLQDQYGRPVVNITQEQKGHDGMIQPFQPAPGYMPQPTAPQPKGPYHVPDQGYAPDPNYQYGQPSPTYPGQATPQMPATLP